MSTRHLLYRLSKLKIDKPPYEAYAAAQARHDARRLLLDDKLRGEAMRFFLPRESAAEWNDMVDHARLILGRDTPEQMVIDQMLLTAHHGSRRAARKSKCWGHNYDQMRRHVYAWELREARKLEAELAAADGAPPS